MPEETLCQEVREVASLATSHQNKYNDVSDKNTDVMNTYLLEHVKYDFYKKGSDQLTVVVYVKEIDKESLQVNFEVKALRLKFQTRSKEFLKLHNQVSEDTVFEWNVHLRHQVDCENCKYAITQSKLTMTLKKACVKDQWNSLEELNMKGVGDERLKNGQGQLSNTTGYQVADRDNIKTSSTEHLSNTTGGQVAERDNIKTSSTGHLSNTTGGQVAERDNIKTSSTEHLSNTTGGQVAERDDIKTGNRGHLSNTTGGQVAERDNIKTGSAEHLSNTTGGQVAERDNIKTGSTEHLSNTTGGQVAERDNIKTGSTEHLSNTTGGQVAERDNIKTGSTGHLSNTTGGQVAERDNIKTGSTEHLSNTTGGQVAERDNMKIKTENGNVNLKHCNGNNANFSNENQTRVSSKNNLGLDAKGVPHSLADDADDMENISNGNSESIRTKQTVNSNNDKDCEVNEKTNGLDDDSEDVLCDEMKITANRVTDSCAFNSTTKERDTACANHTPEQHNVDNKDLSDPTSTSENIGNLTNHTGKSNDTTESSSVKVPNKNKVLDFDESREKNNMVEENKNLKLSYDAKKHDCRPGSAGLVNYANLCYINSVVQCLSSIIELRTYLLSKEHSSHINRDNKNGYHGELISAFDSLIQELWSGKERSVSASKLKYILGKKHKQFMYYGQEDAQEFLTFLVDGLHEDLKEEKKKALRETKTDDSKDVLESSRVLWEKYINGNTSIISDLFQGQSVSNTHCKECTKPSTAFDHWMQLNLPIPEDPKYLPVHVFFLDPEKKPLKTKLKVCQRTRSSDLVTQLSHIVDIPARCLVLMRSQYSRISRIYDPIEEVSLSSNNEILIACEILVLKQEVSTSNTKDENACGESCESNFIENIDKQCSYDVVHISVIQRLTHRVTGKCNHCGLEKLPLAYCSKCCKVAYCDRECQRNDWKCHRQYCDFQPLIIGTPFIISVDASKATLNNLQKKAFSYARYSVAPRKGQLESSKFHLTLLETLTDFHSKGTKLTDKGSTLVVDENACLALDWVATSSDSKVISKDLVCNIHESVNEKHSSEDNFCSLEECLKLYWNPENINKECGWRCDHCKDVRAATRKVMICKHPENLVIHLKRFSFSGNGRKISKHIQFPLRGLDMSPFTHPELTRDRAIYDLRAVCSHYGDMNFGHYIAFCKPYSEEELDALALTNTDGWLRYDDSRVNSAEESEVEKTCAYILFYHRRKNASSCMKQTLKATCTKSEDTSKTDRCDPQAMQESVETSEVATEQNTTVNNIKNTSILVKEHGSTSHLSSDCSSTNGETLLEDILD